MDDSYQKFADVAKEKMKSFGPKPEIDSAEPGEAEGLTPEEESLLSKVKEAIAKSPAFKAAIKAC